MTPLNIISKLIELDELTELSNLITYVTNYQNQIAFRQKIISNILDELYFDLDDISNSSIKILDFKTKLHKTIDSLNKYMNLFFSLFDDNYKYLDTLHYTVLLESEFKIIKHQNETIKILKELHYQLKGDSII